MADEGTADGVPIPALLRHARGAFSRSIRRELLAVECGDLPANGPYVLGGMANREVASSQLLRELGISERASGQLVDTLVVRGYLTRAADPSDRRKVNLELTDRGRAAASAVPEGIDSVDAELERRLSPEELRGLRRGLVELIAIKEELEDEAAVGDALRARTRS
jgi:DNA-binding MarR family transcriptional regulator